MTRDASTNTVTERLELRALERMISALLNQIEQWIQSAKEKGRLRTRECNLQAEAFMDRREKARALLGMTANSVEPMEVRITRLQQMVESLQCSQAYFRAV